MQKLQTVSFIMIAGAVGSLFSLLAQADTLPPNTTTFNSSQQIGDTVPNADTKMLQTPAGRIQAETPVETYGSPVVYSDQAPAASPTVRTLGTLNATDAPSPHYSASMANTSDDVATDAALQPIQVGNITYVTGGIGDEERNTLQMEQKDYNLRVMSANKSGEFYGDTHIVIRDHAGSELLNAAAGPLFFAKLPAGRYTVEASNQGQVKTQHINVSGSKPALVHLSW